MTSSNLVRLENVGVKRNNRWLVRHVDLHVDEGEIVTLVGPNGSGKSTTLKMATHVLAPDEGKVWSKPNLTIGYVPQAMAINSSIPIDVARMMAVGAKCNASEITKALEHFQIAHLADAQIHSLSGGEFQRLALARATLHKPQLLVLDEPGQGVDISGQMEIYDFIRTCRDQTGAGIVMVSHDLHFVMAATDRVICMNGHICCSGTPQSVAENPQYLELLGAGASQSLAFYQHTHDHVHLADGTVQHADGSITSDCHPDDGHHHD